MKLTDVAKIIRSKNAGPFELTLDILFRHSQTYQQFKTRDLLTEDVIAKLYNINRDDILGIVYFDPACAIKINIKRNLSSGSPGETDVYGAQQHAPLLKFEFTI